MKIKIIVILGPTAVGKTALGIQLAKQFHGRIVSGDSQQVYRQLDIGTAKATPKEQAAVKHYLIDVRDVAETYSAFDFVTEASHVIDKIVKEGYLPILVGGTGLYIQSLLEGYHLGGEHSQEEVLTYRAELDRLTDADLFGRVEELGLEIPQLNRRRAIRALEIARFGKDLENSGSNYDALLIGLDDDRQALYQRINDRVDTMLDLGLVEEARFLYEHYPDAQAVKGIGYKEFFPYFKGEISKEQAVEQIKQNTRRFAKRQLTWFRNRMKVPFYQVSDTQFLQAVQGAVEEFLHD